MSSLIVVCARDRRRLPTEDALRRCAAELAPDNIRPTPPIIDATDGSAAVVVNPVPGIAVRHGCVCLGRVFGDPGVWWRFGAEAPEGNYVIARRSAEMVEVLTDVLASRQLWYAQTGDLFVASTSQRALVMILGSFDLDPQAVTSMLTSGHVGGRSWDARVRRLAGDSRLVLDRAAWRVTVVERPAVRTALELSDDEHVARLREAILTTCAALDLPADEWLLALSGGLDSRALLMGLIHAGVRPRCVTWGRRAALQDRHGDASVARELARRHGLTHSYWATDEDGGSIELAMDRFLRMAEGQVCDFGAYTDGMAMWKAFYEGGVAGVIRGDEPGIGDVYRCESEAQVLRRHNRVRVAEYPPEHPIHQLGLAEFDLETRLCRRPEESLRSWDVRLDEESFYPTMLVPLTTVKAAFVEVVNPLTSRRVTEVVRRFPDRLRVERRPLREVVASLDPRTPVAKVGALGGDTSFWSDPLGRAAIRRALRADDAERIMSRSAIDVVLGGLSHAPPTAGVRRVKEALRVVVPDHFVQRVRPVWPLRLHWHELAFRTYVAVRTAGLLAADAALLAPARRGLHSNGPPADIPKAGTGA